MAFKPFDKVIDAERLARGGDGRVGTVQSVKGDTVFVQWPGGYHTDEYGSNGRQDPPTPTPASHLVPYSKSALAVLEGQVGKKIRDEMRAAEASRTARNITRIQRAATAKADERYRKSIDRSTR